jgi:Ca-activated chloride channel family protein
VGESVFLSLSRTAGVTYDGGYYLPPDSKEPDFNTNEFDSIADNPLSTFSIDADTAGYGVARFFIEHNERPPKSAARIEEFINYFDYDYAPPSNEKPFAAHIETGVHPWNADQWTSRINCLCSNPLIR